MFSHLCELIFCFAKNGSESVKNALYKKYDDLYTILKKRRFVRDGHLFSEHENYKNLCTQLISLDGFDAFKRISEDIGTLFNINKIYSRRFDWFFSDSKNKFGKNHIYNFLKKNRSRSNDIERFLLEMQKEEIENEQRKVKRKEDNLIKNTVEDVIKAANESNQHILLFGAVINFAKNSNEQERITLAQAVLEEDDLFKKAIMLKAFTLSECPFPLDCEPLMKYALFENEKLKYIAFSALAQIVDEKVHDLTVVLIKNENEVEYAIKILAKNYRKEDEFLFVSAFKSIPVVFRITGTIYPLL